MPDIVRAYGSASTTAETPLGPLHVWATSREHVGISTRGGRDNGDAAESVTVQRVDYTVRLDLHPESYYIRKREEQERNGGRNGLDWQSEPEPAELAELGWSSGRGDSHLLTRVDWTSYRDSHGSPSATRKARDLLTRWAVEWLATDDGRALLDAGQEQSDAAERATLERERAEVAARLEAIDARLEELQ